MQAGTDELLLLRLALIAVIFIFVVVAALTMRMGLRPGQPRPAAARAPRDGARLLVVSPGESGIAAGTEFPIEGLMVLGRSPGSGIVIGDSSISGEHATIARQAGGWRLVDLGSTNGTVVNGRRVDGRGVMLRRGDIVTLGAVVLRFEV